MMDYYDPDKGQSERSRWTPLTRMLLSGEMTQERQKELSPRERFDKWMINEGTRRVYVCSPTLSMSWRLQNMVDVADCWMRELK
jgi:hypothetical protein